jgi:hypothetical protein
VLKKEEFKIRDGICVTCVPSKKFRTTQISFTMFTPLCAGVASQNAIIPELLVNTCAKYPTFSDLNKHLDELYGTNLSSSVDKCGDVQVLTVSAVFVNSDFVYDSTADIFSRVCKLICNAVFHPLVYDDKFF